MSVATYNAGVAARKAAKSAACSAGSHALSLLRGITDFARGIAGAEPSAPTAKAVTTKPRVRKPATKK